MYGVKCFNIINKYTWFFNYFNC